METFNLNLDKYKQLCNLTTKAVEKSHATERGEIIKEIMETLNINRAKNKFSPLTFPRMGLLLPKEIPTKDLYSLLSQCKDAGNRGKNYHESFSKTFYWLIKAK